MEEYKKAESHIKGLKADLPGDDAIDLLSDNTAKLTSAITSLPELIKKKTEIDKHMSIAMGKFKVICNEVYQYKRSDGLKCGDSCLAVNLQDRI